MFSYVSVRFLSNSLLLKKKMPFVVEETGQILLVLKNLAFWIL